MKQNKLFFGFLSLFILAGLSILIFEEPLINLIIDSWDNTWTATCVMFLWWLWSVKEGHREGFYWHFKSTYGVKTKIREHFTWTVQRAVVLLFCSAFIIILTGINAKASTVVMVALACQFSFFHNGKMYVVRNILNYRIYQKRFFAEPILDDNENATWEFSTMTRSVLFAIGVIMFIYALAWG